MLVGFLNKNHRQLRHTCSVFETKNKFTIILNKIIIISCFGSDISINLQKIFVTGFNKNKRFLGCRIRSKALSVRSADANQYTTFD